MISLTKNIFPKTVSYLLRTMIVQWKILVIQRKSIICLESMDFSFGINKTKSMHIYIHTFIHPSRTPPRNPRKCCGQTGGKERASKKHKSLICIQNRITNKHVSILVLLAPKTLQRRSSGRQKYRFVGFPPRRPPP